MSEQPNQATEVPQAPIFGFDSCPACGQEIPSDKLEEIGGRIVARDRDQRKAIAAELVSKFEAEKSRAEVRANAELAAERERSIEREAAIREEARRAAQQVIKDSQDKADKAYAELAAEWQRRLSDAETARRSAELTETTLKAELIALKEKGALELEAHRREIEKRVAEVRNEAAQQLELAVIERMAEVERARRESEASLQDKINESEANRIKAENEQAVLRSQIETLRQSGEIEIAKIKEEAAKEAARISRDAAERAELRHRDHIAAQERALSEANLKALEAERTASELEQTLINQREIMERSKEDAVNAEKAKAFEETQKLSTKVSDLQRALERKTNEELGEGAEINIFDALKSQFKDDKIERIRKGSPGADVRHVVMHCGQQCGMILYDSKNHIQWRDEHATKLRKDQLAAKAEHAILSTHKFPRGARQLHVRDGVLLANPARVVSLAEIIRQHLIQVHTLRVSEIERESKTVELYKFITSDHCGQLLDRIDKRADSLLELQEKEMRWHQNNWKHQGEALRAIQKAKVDLASEINSIIGTSSDSVEMSEAS